MKRFLIVCGGTGGHLAPGISIAEMLDEEGHRCRLLVSRSEVDSRLRRKYDNLDFTEIPGAPFGWRPRVLLRFLSQSLQGLIRAWQLIRRERPHLVLAFGGYLSIGMVLMASWHRIPVALHEANRRPGKAIRALRRMAVRLYLPAGVHLRHVPPVAIRHYGYPVRREMRRISRNQGRRHLNLDPGGKLLVVVGGSLGALALNQWVRKHFPWLAERDIHVVCVTGEGKGEPGEVEHCCSDGRVRKLWSLPFCDQMNSLLCAADVVVSRAGAGSIAELIRCRTPSILIPFPQATDNHQEANALFVERQGAAMVIPQRDLGQLAEEVVELMQNSWLLERFRDNLTRLDAQNKPEAMLKDLVALASASSSRWGEWKEIPSKAH